MSAEQRNIRIQLFVLLVGVLLMVIKFAAWRITDSAAILSDALESIVNVLAGGFALFSLVLAAKPRDREHPYGHGKVEFISASIEGGLVLLAGILIVVQAIIAFLEGNELHRLEKGILLTAIAGFFNLLMGLLLRHRGRITHSMTMVAGGTHLLSDAWSTVAMLIGLVLIRITGENWLDSLFALGFGVFILVQGFRVLRRAVGGIMDETDMDVAAQVVRVLEAHRQADWVDVHNLRVIQVGRGLHIDCHLTLPWYYTLEQAHARIEAVEQVLREHHERPVELFIHMDPCQPSSCAICLLEGCAHRQRPFEERITWGLESALKNQAHHASKRSGKAGARTTKPPVTGAS